MKPALFSANSEGACPNCNGAGVVYTDLGDDGRRRDHLRGVRGPALLGRRAGVPFGGRDISEVLGMSITEAEAFFAAGFKKRLDYSEYGGAPLLGIRGVCIVNHGSSNDRAIYNGIRVTAEFALAGVNQQLEQEFACRRPADPPSEPEMSEPIQPLY